MGRHATKIQRTEAAAADAQALNVLARGGRSFFWASHFLGRKTAYNAAHLYQFCRTLDDLADGDIADGPARLAAIQTQLERLADGKAIAEIDPALAAFLPVMKACHVPIMPFLHLLEGLLFDQGEVAIASEDGLIKYAYQVAGTVGLLMCPILGCQNRHAFCFAVDMGIAMQLTNIARDVLEDAKMGRRYLPAQWTGNLGPQDICEAARDPQGAEALAIKTAIDRLLHLANRYYESGQRGLVYLPFRAHIAIAVAANVYREIGQKLRRRQLDWTRGRAVTNGAEKTLASLTASASLAARVCQKPAYQAGLQSALFDYTGGQNYPGDTIIRGGR